ncbi:phosphoribosyltransferase [uncultured Fusobacterium sp.]|uniref:phosphoribosyltransferase n=1 Tax=uncultured Fusobacterium sp. TaxID=159267 RepID=UPI0027DD51B8|nr:phosphoribosyltransferase [uncultured Fusobacterium sp.]
MNYLELSETDVRKESRKLAKKIEKDFNPEVVIFIAKGSYYIGDELSKYFNVSLLEIHAAREKNKLKKIISPMLKLIPKNIKKRLRELEIISGIHNKKNIRNVYMKEKLENKLQNYKKVLLVDDSVDSGNTILAILNYLKKYNLEIKIAALNVFNVSKEVVTINYFNYEDIMLNGPWSNDSKYNSSFLKDYMKWKMK